MPLHKSSSRASRLDPTMISAPLDDFRHTMHIGRGGDAFGDTSFLSTHGPGNNTTGSGSDLGAPGSTVAADSQMPNISHDENGGSTDSMEASDYTDLSRDHSESVSSFTLDLDLGPSILGDVLGVMDGLGLDSTNEEDIFTSSNNATLAEMKSGRGEPKDLSVCAQNEFNGKEPVEMEETQTRDHKDGTPAVGNWSKAKGLRPKVRFSDKREEIIRQASEEEEGQGFTFEEDGEHSPQTPTEGQKGSYAGVAGEAESTTLRADIPPSPASSHSSDNNGSSPLHCRLVETSHFETDSDDEEEEETGDCGRGYTFEDEFDDEIGL